jgi:nucleoside-triphosphatase THEP1
VAFFIGGALSFLMHNTTIFIESGCMMNTSDTDNALTETLPVAAIVHEERGQADVLIAQLVTELRDVGHHVLGIMKEPASTDPGTCKQDMILIDIDSGDRYNISQDLGTCSEGCTLDPSVVTEASVVLRRALEARPDLIVVNRFGKLEMVGSGFHAEMIAIIEAGIPVITAVSTSHYSAWEVFTGGCAVNLAPDADAIADWCRQYLPAKGL